MPKKEPTPPAPVPTNEPPPDPGLADRVADLQKTVGELVVAYAQVRDALIALPEHLTGKQLEGLGKYLPLLQGFGTSMKACESYAGAAYAIAKKAHPEIAAELGL